MTPPSPTVLVIIGSVRPRRICPQVAEWVAEVGREVLSAARFELVDLKDWPLPLDAEPSLPQRGDYLHDATRAWSRKVSQADAVALVSPQYNWGYPAVLKNALDHLYREWAGKPALIVTYGGHGGRRCAAQLRQVLEGLHMRPAATMPGLTLARDRIEADAGRLDPAQDFAADLPVLRQGLSDLGALLAS